MLGLNRLFRRTQSPALFDAPLRGWPYEEATERSINTSQQAPPSAPPVFAGVARRIIVPMRCSVSAGEFIARWRKDTYSGRAVFESTRILPGPATPPVRATGTYEIAELDFSRAKCPYCRALAGPVLCTKCSRLLCRGGIDPDTYSLSCLCGNAGDIIKGLRVVTGFEGDSVETVLPRASSTSPRLAAPDALIGVRS